MQCHQGMIQYGEKSQRKALVEQAGFYQLRKGRKVWEEDVGKQEKVCRFMMPCLGIIMFDWTIGSPNMA